MTPSADLYATATSADAEARHHQHRDPARAAMGQLCDGVCARCRLAAKARLYGRAGDAAAAVADGGPTTIFAAIAAQPEE